MAEPEPEVLNGLDWTCMPGQHGIMDEHGLLFVFIYVLFLVDSMDELFCNLLFSFWMKKYNYANATMQVSVLFRQYMLSSWHAAMNHIHGDGDLRV
jgi:hypothetical protein